MSGKDAKAARDYVSNIQGELGKMALADADTQIDIEDALISNIPDDAPDVVFDAAESIINTIKGICK